MLNVIKDHPRAGEAVAWSNMTWAMDLVRRCPLPLDMTGDLAVGLTRDAEARYRWAVVALHILFPQPGGDPSKPHPKENEPMLLREISLVVDLFRRCPLRFEAVGYAGRDELSQFLADIWIRYEWAKAQLHAVFPVEKPTAASSEGNRS